MAQIPRMSKISKITVLLATTSFTSHHLSLAQEIELDDEIAPITDRKCRLYSSASASTIVQLMDAADMFNVFGEYKDMLMMKEFDVQAKENILKGTLCEEVCEKGHSYCKSFKREMADEEFEQVAMFKGLMKNMDVTSKLTPPVNVAKKVADRMFTAVDLESLSESDITGLELKLKEMIKENLNLNKVGDLVQVGLDKFGIPLNMKKLVGENPGALLQGAKKMWGVVQGVIEQKNGKSLNLGELLPKGLEILKGIAKDVGANMPDLDVDVKGDNGNDDDDEDGDDFDDADFDADFEEDVETDPFDELAEFEAEISENSKDEL